MPLLHLKSSDTFLCMERPKDEPTIPWWEESRVLHEELEAIWAEQKLHPPTAEERIASLKRAQELLGLTKETSEAWIRESRALRYGDDPTESE
jgi:hypothetical protein